MATSVRPVSDFHTSPPTDHQAPAGRRTRALFARLPRSRYTARTSYLLATTDAGRRAHLADGGTEVRTIGLA